MAPAPAPPPAAPAVVAVAWAPRPFADVVLDTPELAACFVLTPGAWTSLAAPATLGDPAAIALAVEAQLSGVLTREAVARLTVVVGESASGALTAVASGATTLLVVPAGQPPQPGEAARTVVAALLRAHTSSAPPDPRCGEPLLALAEAIALAGSSSLALLPPALRPVADWLEAREAAAPLATFVEAALDGETPWSERRLRLRQTALRSSTNVGVLHAAARLVEAFGDLQQARQRPLELLLAWRENRDKRYPEPPAGLRRALADPFAAGAPGKDRAEDEKLIAADALERAVESGAIASSSPASGAALPLRELAAAQARARGAGNPCQWVLAGEVPASRRTGCRSDEKPASYVAAVPQPTGGFHVVAAAEGGESVLLRWPRWLLFPSIRQSTAELVFVDEQGVWRVVLDGAAPPRLLAGGAFRHLVMAPGGDRLAAARWPSGAAVVIAADGTVRELGVSARGGIAWLDADLLLAAAEKGAVVASVTGETRPFPVPLACVRSLARAGESLLVGVAPPCEAGVLRVSLGEEAAKPVVARSDGPLGIVPMGAGLLFGDAEGIIRQRPGEDPERIGGGLTPGPD